MSKRNIDSVVEEINLILNNLQQNSKSETLAYQRGYLTGWLARLATTDTLIRQEIKSKVKLLQK